MCAWLLADDAHWNLPRYARYQAGLLALAGQERLVSECVHACVVHSAGTRSYACCVGAPTRRYESVKALDGLEMSVLQGQDAGSGGADIVMVCLLPMLDLSVNGPEACRDGHRATLTVRYV